MGSMPSFPQSVLTFPRAGIACHPSGPRDEISAEVVSVFVVEEAGTYMYVP